MDIDVWQISLASEPARVACCSALLEEGERDRAARFHFSQDRERFMIARGSLRQILGHYLNVAPETVRFRYGPNGKPELETSGQLHFNLSHSHEVGLLAVVLGQPVGVDIEKILPERVDDTGIADRFFTAAEADRVRSAATDRRADVFYRIWTRKEAFLKGCGVGLSRDLNQFEVSLEDSAIRGAAWSVHELRPCAGYVAAVAVERARPKFVFRSLNEARVIR
jgi:4'-phosphopantetheinyl transferase